MDLKKADNILTVEIVWAYWHLFGVFVPMGPEAVLCLINFPAGNLITGRRQNKITTQKVHVNDGNVHGFTVHLTD